MKKYTGTALHVYFAGNFKTTTCGGCCSRLYFTFNGNECSSPGTIDGAFYQETNVNHRHRHIEGHCHNIKKGTVRVGLSVGKCVTGDKLADSLTGWHSMSRIFIEEVPKPHSSKLVYLINWTWIKGNGASFVMWRKVILSAYRNGLLLNLYHLKK